MRIITGRAKGLKLKAPQGFSTRPTADRVKESVFNVLNGMINFDEVEKVLDVFAGTGSLGLEALSRGAGSGVFVDYSTTEIICENVRRAKFSDVATIIRGNFASALKKLSLQQMKFDLIFVDPPYKKNLAENTLGLIADFELLQDAGIIVVEYGADEIIDTKEFESIRKITYGRTTAVEFLRVKRD